MKNMIPMILSLLAAGLFTGCSDPAASPVWNTHDSAVTVVTARPTQNSSNGISASGVIEAVNTAAVSTRLMGTITHIYVKIGDKVGRGQLLATISSDEIKAKKAQVDAQIDGARADLENARKDFNRYNTLFSRQSATTSELDNATLRLNAAKARLEGTEQMRAEIDASGAYARLTAPFSGIITQKLVDEGSLATPGNPILIVEQADMLQVNTMVPESEIGAIRVGDKAELVIKATGLRANGTVTQVSASSIATGGQYQLKIGLPRDVQKDLFAGMYVNVFIPGKPAGIEQGAGDAGKSIFVPLSAVIDKDQLTGIYTVSNNHTALLRWIRTGRTSGDKVEVLSGLNPDESFITHSAGKLYNGAPVIEK